MFVSSYEEEEHIRDVKLVIQNLEYCDHNTYLKMVHRIEPIPLLSVLNFNSFASKVSQDGNDFIIYIWQNHQNTLERYIEDL